MTPVQNLISKLRGNKPNAPAADAPSPAKRAHALSRALDAALEACSAAELDPTCATIATLEDLGALIDDGTLKLDPAALPVALAEFDGALEDLREIKLRASALKVLEDLRGDFAEAVEAEERRIAAGNAAPVTRGEFNAFRFALALALEQIEQAHSEPNGAGPVRRLARLAENADALGLSAAQAAALADMIGQIGRASDLTGKHERQQAAARPHRSQPWASL